MILGPTTVSRITLSAGASAAGAGRERDVKQDTSNRPDSPSPSPSGPDATAVHKAADIVNQRGVTVAQINSASTFVQGQRLARAYRTALFEWEAALRKIDYPDAGTTR